MDYAAPVERVSRKPVGMPGKDAIGFATLDAPKKFVENGASWILRAARFLSVLNYKQPLTFRIASQFLALGFDR